MAGSLLVAVRSALVTAVAELDAFQGFEVMYAYKPVDCRFFAYTRQPQIHHEPTALKAGRNFRKEEGRFEFVIWVEDVGGSPEEAATRALDAGLALEEYVADNKDGIAGETWLLVDGDLEFGEAVNDRAAYAEIVYPIRYLARLT